MANGQTALGKLAERKEAIEKELAWDQLDTVEKVERLRGFTKQSLTDIIARQQKQMDMFERRIQELEAHTHDSSGRPIIEKVLSDRKQNYEMTLSAPHVDPMAVAGGGGYI